MLIEIVSVAGVEFVLVLEIVLEMFVPVPELVIVDDHSPSRGIVIAVVEIAATSAAVEIEASFAVALTAVGSERR